MTELSKEFKKKLEDLAEKNEEKIADVSVLFMALKAKIIELEPQLSDMNASIRTYNGLLNYYSNKRFNRGTEFIIIPMGINSEPKDTNKVLRDQILKDFSNPEKRLAMIDGESGVGIDSKVMTMKTSEEIIDNEGVFFHDVYKPVKTIRKMTQLSNGEWVVIDGDLWTPGDKPIPRNYKKTIQYVEEGEIYDNKGWSKSLMPNWKFAIFGLGYFSGLKQVKKGEEFQKVQKNPIEDGLISRIIFYGKLADPNHVKFIAKKDLWFKPCKLKVTDSKYSNELYLQVTAKSDLDVSPNKVKLVPYLDKDKKEKPGIITLANKRIKAKADKLMGIVAKTDFDALPKEKAKKLHDLESLYKKFVGVDYIPVIDLAGTHEYHMTHKAILGEDGQPIKGDDEVWDKIDFDSFAISECAFGGIYTKEGKAPKMILSDYSMPDNQSLFCKFSNGLDTEIPPSSVYVSLTTSRGNSVYDVDTKEWIVDPDNAIAMPKIKGIGVIFDFKKIDIEKLAGDL